MSLFGVNHRTVGKTAAHVEGLPAFFAPDLEASDLVGQKPDLRRTSCKFVAVATWC